MIKLSMMRGSDVYISIRVMHLMLILRTLVYENNLDAAMFAVRYDTSYAFRKDPAGQETANVHVVYVRFMISCS